MIAGISGIMNDQNLYLSIRRAQNVEPPAHTVAVRPASPQTPVQPVTPVRSVPAEQPVEDPGSDLLLRWATDPASVAGRSRIEYLDDAALEKMRAEKNAGQGVQGTEEAKSAQEVMKEGECQRCRERKYQDGSDDPGVSFKTPSHIDPEMAASAVRGHEMEHVVRERANAQREDRKVVSQFVTYHTGICPECGKVYVSGGTTRTTTAAERQPSEQAEGNQRPAGGFSALC